jgi:hypothetical protein
VGIAKPPTIPLNYQIHSIYTTFPTNPPQLKWGVQQDSRKLPFKTAHKPEPFMPWISIKKILACTFMAGLGKLGCSTISGKSHLMDQT